MWVPLLCISSALASSLPRDGPKVLILGGGVAGIIAARTFHQQGIENFLIIEARDELGGRMRSHPFGGYTIELGANWIQGTQEGDGPANPIYELALKHDVQTHYNDLYGSISKSVKLQNIPSILIIKCPATFDISGQVDYLDVFNNAVDAFSELTVEAGMVSITDLQHPRAHIPIRETRTTIPRG